MRIYVSYPSLNAYVFFTIRINVYIHMIQLYACMFISIHRGKERLYMNIDAYICQLSFTKLFYHPPSASSNLSLRETFIISLFLKRDYMVIHTYHAYIRMHVYIQFFGTHLYNPSNVLSLSFSVSSYTHL